MLSYDDVMNYIKKISACGIVPGLESITRLCARLGNPQDRMKFVHIAGTNGKGSVLAFISTVLSCGGYKVGRYISPAVFGYREKIQIDGSYISLQELCEGMEIVKNACDDIVNNGFSQPTPFEIETALAFWYFEKKGCDIVVLETGMGGLLDATNIIQNTLVAVITSIGMDHMKFLGNTLEEITYQKAGIIKKGCVVVAMGGKQCVIDIIRDEAAKKGCKFVCGHVENCLKNNMQSGAKHVSAIKKVSNIRYGIDGQSFDYGDMKNIQIKLCGKYQIDNAVLALNVIDELGECGFGVSERAVREGLCSTVWQGRFQVLRKNPYFIVDGAHNEDAAKKIADTLDLYFTNRRFIYIMGMLRDKACEDFVSITAHYADEIITVTPPDNARAMGAEELAGIVSEVAGGCDVHGNIRVTAADSLETAVNMALGEAAEDDVILAFGSLSFLGEVIDIVKT